MTSISKSTGCPCGSGIAYSECCGRFHSGEAFPETAESLMRSRYTAFVLADETYLLDTWHSSTRPSQLNLAQLPPAKWLGLKIKRTQEGRPGDVEGVVEFVARYRVAGKAVRLHEVSRFVREADRWVYLAGDLDPG